VHVLGNLAQHEVKNDCTNLKMTFRQLMSHKSESFCLLCKGEDGAKTIDISLVIMIYIN
jgi:hypothetical protein